MTRAAHLMRRMDPGFNVLTDESKGTGTHYYVSSVAGAANNTGLSPSSPLLTIQAAIDLCINNQGDHIWVMEGHAETLATLDAILVNEGGLTISGLGNGTLRPTLTFGTLATACFTVNANNLRLTNIRFVSDVDSLVNFLNLDEGNFVCEDCEFITSSTKEALCFVNIGTTKDNFTFRRCKFFQPTDPAGSDGAASTGVFYFEDSENLFFEDCFLYVNGESAIWHNKTTAAKNVWILNCYGTQLLTGAEVFIQVANMEGGVVNSLFVITGADDVTEAKTWGTMSDKFFISPNSGIGNDGAGGQLAVAGATAAS